MYSTASYWSDRDDVALQKQKFNPFVAAVVLFVLLVVVVVVVVAATVVVLQRTSVCLLFHCVTLCLSEGYCGSTFQSNKVLLWMEVCLAAGEEWSTATSVLSIQIPERKTKNSTYVS